MARFSGMRWKSGTGQSRTLRKPYSLAVIILGLSPTLRICVIPSVWRCLAQFGRGEKSLGYSTCDPEHLMRNPSLSAH